MRAFLLISALGVVNGVGCKMAFGASRRRWCDRSFLVGCPAGLAATGLQGAGRRTSTGGHTHVADGMAWSGGDGECVVAGGAQGVVAAAGELAGDGDEGDVGLETLTESSI